MMVEPTEQEFFDTTQTMIDYGGGFVKGLAKLMRIADHINRPKLINAFPEYWCQYRDMEVHRNVITE